MKSRRGRTGHIGIWSNRSMVVLLANAWICTMDDAGTELPARLAARARRPRRGGRSGEAPAADERVDLGGAVVTPGLVNTHHHLYQTLTRARAQEVDRSSSGCASCIPVWARDRRRGRVRGGAHRARRAGALRLHDRLRPPLRLPARPGGPDRGRGAGGARARRADRRLARLDGPRRLRRAACRPTSSSRRSTSCSRRRSGSSASCQDERVQIAVAPCSPFSVTKQLMVESAELARRLGLRLHTHLAETLEEDAYCLELYGCRPGRVPRAARLARRATSGARTASTSRRRTCARSGERGYGRRALPDLEPAPRGGRRAGARPARRGRPVGLGVDGSASNERCDLLLRGQAGAARRARARRRPDRADRARGAAARHARRRGRAAAATTSARSTPGQARRLRGLAHRRARARRRRRPRRGARALGAAPGRPALVGGEEVVRDGHLVRADEEEIAREHRVQARRFS